MSTTININSLIDKVIIINTGESSLKEVEQAVINALTKVMNESETKKKVNDVIIDRLKNS
jgi:hypothetical protein